MRPSASPSAITLRGWPGRPSAPRTEDGQPLITMRPPPEKGWMPSEKGSAQKPWWPLVEARRGCALMPRIVVDKAEGIGNRTDWHQRSKAITLSTVAIGSSSIPSCPWTCASLRQLKPHKYTQPLISTVKREACKVMALAALTAEDRCRHRRGGRWATTAWLEGQAGLPWRGRPSAPQRRMRPDSPRGTLTRLMRRLR